MSQQGHARPQAPFGARELVVARRTELGPYVVVTLLDTSGVYPAAGQFYMVRAQERWGGGEDGRPYLPRALSFARAQESAEGLLLDFFFEVVGPGTERLGELEVGAGAVVTGPFGNGFSVADDERPLLVAGGIGLAPIVALADELAGQGRPVAPALVGMRSAAHAASIEHYGLAHSLTTDDGSAGREGFVTQLLEDALDADPHASVFACGPGVMLEAVRALCASRGARAELAMEAGMACGFGACHGCVVPTREGYVRLCVDGPVLEAGMLESALELGGAH